MKTITKTLLVVTAVIVAGSVTVGCFRPHRYSHDKKTDWAVKIIVSELDLDDEQEVKLNAIKDETLSRFKEESTDRDKIRLEVMSMIKNDSLNAADINRFLDKREERMKELRPFIVEKIVEFHAMLTPEQREKLAEFIEEHQCGHGFDY